MSTATHQPDPRSHRAAHEAAAGQREGDARPVLAAVTGHLTPYREHMHRRIAGEIPELRLATLVTKYRTGPWVNPAVPEIGTVMLDPEAPPEGGRRRAAFVLHEIGTARRTRAWLGAHNVAAVICGGYDEIPNVAALRWARRRGVPAFLWADSNEHGDRAAGLKRLVKNTYVPWACRQYAGVLVFGRAGRGFFRRYGVDESRMWTMPLEPDYELIEGLTRPEIDGVMSRFGLAAGRMRMVCCCRLVREKRVEQVIAAFARIALERPEWDLLIVGDGPLRAALEREVPAPLASAGRIRLLGFQDQHTVSCIYRASHALVLASDYEPWALVVNEAAAAGLALVTSDKVGAAYELLADGHNGRQFRSGDAEALAAAIREVTDPGNIEAMRERSAVEVARWRREADPVQGLRGALRAAGVLSAR